MVIARPPWPRIITTPLACGCLLAFSAGSALAGDVSLTAGAFGNGYALPLNGLAALLGFVAMGLWSGALGGALIWQLPIIAISGALVAGLIAEAGVALPYAHDGVLCAPIILGVFLVLGIRVPLLSPPLVVGLVAVFEGFPLAQAVHGPHLWPWLGFSVAAAVAMSGGLGLTVLVSRAPFALGIRTLGAAIATLGVLMLLDRV